MTRAGISDKSIRCIKVMIKTLLGVLLLFFVGCKQSVTIQKITDGAYCYHATDNENLFLYLEFSNKNVKGRIYRNDEVLGKVFDDFDGKIHNDSTLNVEIHSYHDDIPQQWIIRYTNEGMILNNLSDKRKTAFIAVPCEKMLNSSEYFPYSEVMAEYEYEEDGETTLEENQSLILYFEGYDPNASANKRTQTVEYISIWLNGSALNGKGIGYSEGDPEWTFSFSGRKKGNTYEVTTQFSQSDEQFESSEIWEITENNEKIHISKREDTLFRSTFFRKTEIEDVPDPMMKLLLKGNTN